MHCPLCTTPANPFLTVHRRSYWQCSQCRLTFLDPAHHLTPAAELAEYKGHQNDPFDAGYRQFLSRLGNPLLDRLPPQQHGLDYGCGPGPALALMLRDAGHRVDLYDPYFAPEPKPWKQQYDFITCTETIEHFYRPGLEFDRLNQMLKPGGWLGLMTEVMIDDARFAAWWYTRDPTHVCFYRHETFIWLATRFGWQLENPQKNVYLGHKLKQ